jgi:hypothetical protein
MSNIRTAAEKFWYTLGCIVLAAVHLKKIPVKKALPDFGLVELTGAKALWYILGCFIGVAYSGKVSIKKALVLFLARWPRGQGGVAHPRPD